jgi:hypothetical protein
VYYKRALKQFADACARLGRTTDDVAAACEAMDRSER